MFTDSELADEYSLDLMGPVTIAHSEEERSSNSRDQAFAPFPNLFVFRGYITDFEMNSLHGTHVNWWPYRGVLNAVLSQSLKHASSRLAAIQQVV
jgi:hypothetical protein